MNKLIIPLSKVSLALMLSLCAMNINAQEAPNAPKEDRISNTDLIKLATKAPFRENFTSEEEYRAAKAAWIGEYPDAHKRIVGPTSKPQPSAEELKANEEKQMAAKQAWIASHPEEYAKLLEGTNKQSVPPQY